MGHGKQPNISEFEFLGAKKTSFAETLGYSTDEDVFDACREVTPEAGVFGTFFALGQ